ncbi:hypothetical protein POTOM_048672 [Populus tomentosa]|uniref:Uncharacterized protein n=1 Tax=Populus tomentosa TaxID=118781 RepID=A0A8X7YD52_POPTO|nr:hypothetical protein POTOM_048672 [Populus tomentosa]
MLLPSEKPSFLHPSSSIKYQQLPDFVQWAHLFLPPNDPVPSNNDMETASSHVVGDVHFTWHVLIGRPDHGTMWAPRLVGQPTAQNLNLDLKGRPLQNCRILCLSGNPFRGMKRHAGYQSSPAANASNLVPATFSLYPICSIFLSVPMATAEVVSAQSALAEEKNEQPIKIETATEEAVAAAPEPVAEEPKEVETPAASEEAVAPAPEAPAEVETKEVVEETKILAEEPTVVEKTEEETPKETPEPVVEETKEESPKEIPAEQVVEEAKEPTESGETQAPAPEPEPEPEVAVEAPKEEEEEEVKGEEKPVEAVEKVETETPVEKTE